MIYEDGSTRYIQHNGVELIRMIYSALRDPAWARVSGTIFNETITSDGKSFHIEYDIKYKVSGINFVAHRELSGHETGVVNVTINGTAKSSFRRNSEVLKLPDWYALFVAAPPLIKPSAGNPGGSTGPIQTVRLEPFALAFLTISRQELGT